MKARAGTARAALVDGWRALWRWPLPTLLALCGAAVATVAVRTAWLRAARLADAAGAAVHGGALPWSLWARALAVLLVGHALAALLVDITRAAALSAYGSPLPWRRGALVRPLLLGLVRAPSMISVRALELLVYFALALGDAFVLARGLHGTGGGPAGRAAVATLAVAPSLAMGIFGFAAARVAQALIARGVAPAPALVHGFDVTLRRFASLARLGLAGLVATLPLTLAALLLPVAPLRALLLSLAGLWIYAALVTLLGRDPRLAHG